MLVTAKNDVGKKPGSTALLSCEIKRCGNANTMHHTKAWTSIALSVELNLITTCELTFKDSDRLHMVWPTQTKCANVYTKTQNVQTTGIKKKRIPMSGTRFKSINSLVLQLIHLSLHKLRQFLYIGSTKIKFNTCGFVNFFNGFGVAKLQGI